MQEQGADQAAEEHIHVWSIDVKLINVENDFFEDQVDDDHLNAEDPQWGVEIAALGLRGQLIAGLHFGGHRKERDCVEVAFQVHFGHAMWVHLSPSVVIVRVVSHVVVFYREAVTTATHLTSWRILRFIFIF